MLVRVLQDFIDKSESAKKNKEVIRTVNEEFTVSKERFNEILKVGNFIEEVKKEEVKKKITKPKK